MLHVHSRRVQEAQVTLKQEGLKVVPINHAPHARAPQPPAQAMMASGAPPETGRPRCGGRGFNPSQSNVQRPAAGGASSGGDRALSAAENLNITMPLSSAVTHPTLCAAMHCVTSSASAALATAVVESDAPTTAGLHLDAPVFLGGQEVSSVLVDTSSTFCMVSAEVAATIAWPKEEGQLAYGLADGSTATLHSAFREIPLIVGTIIMEVDVWIASHANFTFVLGMDFVLDSRLEISMGKRTVTIWKGT